MLKPSKFIAAILGAALENFIVRIAFAIVTLIAVGAVTLTLDTQTALLLLIVILTLPSFLTITYLLFKGFLKQSSGVKFVTNSEGMFYLIDNTGKARLIPDETTFYYIADILNEVNPATQLTDIQIAQMRGAPIVSTSEAYRFTPDTLEKKLRRELRDKVIIELQPRLEENPPNLKVKIESLESAVSINSAKLALEDLSENDLSPVHKKVSIYRLIPGSENLHVTPDHPAEITLQLRPDIAPDAILRHLNKLARLYLNVEHGDQSIELTYDL